MPSGEPQAVRVRLIALKGAPALSFVATHATRDVTRNLGVDDGIAEIAASLDPDHAPAFAHATLHAARWRHAAAREQEGQGDAAPARRAPRSADRARRRWRRSRRRRCLAAHDRARERRLPLDLPFLAELGLTDAEPSAGAGDGAQVAPDRQVPRGPRPRARRACRSTTRGDGAAPIRVVDYGCRQGLPDLRRPRAPAPALRRRAAK